MRNVLVVAFLALVTAVVPTPTALPVDGPAPGIPLDYVALGDSFTSGVGTRTYDPESGSCLRSPMAYPVLWAEQQESLSSFAFVACSGATTGDLISNQLDPLSAETDLVTVSIGGNDAGYSQVLATCQTRGAEACDQAIDEALSFIATQLPDRLDTTYAAIRQRAETAEILVIGYPALFETGPCANSIDEQRRARLNTAADELAKVIADRASAAGFGFVDVREAFVGYRVCAAQPWINPPTLPVRESYHPNRGGHAQGYLPELSGATPAASLGTR